MDAELATQACRIRNRILWGRSEPCELRLTGGIVTYTSENHGLLFRVPLAEVRASFPTVLLPFLQHHNIGVKLTVHGKTYRLVFAWVEYHGWQKAPEDYAPAGYTWRGYRPRWSITREGVKSAKAAVQQWRAALEQPANGGQ